jgi:hypothetical protein
VEAVSEDLRALLSSAIRGDAKALQWDFYPRRDSITLEWPIPSCYKPLTAPTAQVCMQYEHPLDVRHFSVMDLEGGVKHVSVNRDGVMFGRTLKHVCSLLEEETHRLD